MIVDSPDALNQVIRELRNTKYKPRTCVLGSRQQFCVHPEVSKLRGAAQNTQCQKLVGANACKFHSKTQVRPVGNSSLRRHGEVQTPEAIPGCLAAFSLLTDLNCTCNLLKQTKSKVFQELACTARIQGYLAYKKPPPPKDGRRTIGMGLL